MYFRAYEKHVEATVVWQNERSQLETIIYIPVFPLGLAANNCVSYHLEGVAMSKRKKKCAGKNAKRLNRENKRKLLQQVGSSKSKLMTGITAFAKISKIFYYWSVMLNIDLSYIQRLFADLNS